MYKTESFDTNVKKGGNLYCHGHSNSAIVTLWLMGDYSKHSFQNIYYLLHFQLAEHFIFFTFR